jgi:thiol-disulfide isomerase/thioredoxin
MIRIICIVSFLLVGCGIGPSSNESKDQKLTNGEIINLTSASKTIIINYWATWCAPCRDEIPELNELAHEYSEVLSEQMQSLGIKFANLLTDPRGIWQLEPITVLPETLIINTKGELIHRLVGPQTKQSLSALIAN